MSLGKVKRNLHSILKRDFILILFLIFFSFLIDFIWLDLYNPSPAWDQGFHLGKVYQYSYLIKNIAISNWEWWSNFWNISDSYRGPLTYLISGLFTNLTSVELKYAILSNSIFNGIIILCIFKFCQRFKEKEVGLWAAFFYTFNPYIFDLRNDYLIDLSQASFIILNFYILTEFILSKNKNYFFSILSGLSFGLLFLIKPTAIIYFILPLIIINIEIFKRTRHYISKYIISISIYIISFLLIVFPWLSNNWLTIITSTINAWNWGIKYQDGFEINTLEGWLFYPIQIINILNPVLISIVMSSLIIYFLINRNSCLNSFKSISNNKSFNYRNLVWYLSLPLNIIILNLIMTTKDQRFILPLIPFLFIILSYLIVNVRLKYKTNKLIKVFISLTVFFSLIFHLQSIFSAKYLNREYIDFDPNKIHKEIIDEVTKFNPNIKTTIGFLPDTKDFNAFNLDAEALKQNNGLRVSQIVSNQNSYKKDLNNFDWFIIKSGNQGVMTSEAKEKLGENLMNSEFFIVQKSWILDDGSELFLFRKKILNQNVSHKKCIKKDLSLEINRINKGFIIEANGKTEDLNNASLIIDFQKEGQVRKVDFSLPKFLNHNLSNNCTIFKGIYTSEYTGNFFENISDLKAYIIKQDNLPEKINDLNFSINDNTRELLPKTNYIEQVSLMGELLRTGQFEELFNLVGLINQSDPEQSYLHEAELIFKNRLLLESVNINDYYALAISQILQKEAKESLLTINKIVELEPVNSYILLAKSVVEVYQFKFNQAYNSIKKAIVHNEDYKINETLNTIYSLTKILSFNFIKEI